MCRTVFCLIISTAHRNIHTHTHTNTHIHTHTHTHIHIHIYIYIYIYELKEISTANTFSVSMPVSWGIFNHQTSNLIPFESRIYFLFLFIFCTHQPCHRSVMMKFKSPLFIYIYIYLYIYIYICACVCVCVCVCVYVYMCMCVCV